MIEIEDMEYGWRPDVPDWRDYTDETEEIREIIPQLKRKNLSKVDLSKHFSPVEDQNHLSACVANALVGIMEYNQKRKYGEHVDLSRLFVYYNAREIAGLKGDSGCFIRSGMESLATMGVCPEKHHKYNVRDVDKEPSNFAYSYAQNYKIEKYYRLDTRGTSKHELLDKVKLNLENGIPCATGFTVFESYRHASKTGDIMFPSRKESINGAHAIAICGFDDNKKIRGLDGKVTKGAFKIRNSYSNRWGDDGCGFLPYEYLLKGLMQDFWCVLEADWVDLDKFKR